jgi:hypothetical protein
MKLPQTGGCQCGKIRCEITEQPWVKLPEGDEVFEGQPAG